MKKILLFAFVSFTTHSFAQQVSGKIVFPKGQKLEAVTQIQKNASMDVMGQAMESDVSATLTESFDIEDANANGATIEYKVKHLVFKANSMGNEQAFDSEKEEDLKGETGKMLEKSIKNKYTMKLDANGKVTEVKVDDDNPNGTKTAANPMEGIIAMQLGINFGVPKVGDATLFHVLPNKTLSAGDTWIDSASANGVNRNAQYKVSSITATDIVVDFTETVSMNMTQDLMGTEATIKTEDKATGQITLDKNSGLLKQKTATVETSGTIDAQGMSIPTTGKTTITITVKPA